MVEDAAGHRTFCAPTPQLAVFLTTAYRFDDVQVATCHAWRSGPRWMVQARPPAALIRHRTPQHAGLAAMGHTRPAGPNAMVGGLLDLAICRLLPGVRTRGRTRDGRASGTEPKICTPIIAPDAALAGRDLGALGAVRPPVGFSFGSVLHRPSLVHITTTFEAVRPGGSDGA